VTAHRIVEMALLAFVVLACWLGVLGMWRMRQPIQALQYLSLPACGGMTVLTVAVFVKTGSSQAAWKSVLICLILLAINSVVTHATARAFRTRDLGHWQPLDGDPIEFVPHEAGTKESAG
jgi:multisubunit Na+/H+ antiporter MnhG subunit